MGVVSYEGIKELIFQLLCDQSLEGQTLLSLLQTECGDELISAAIMAVDYIEIRGVRL